MGDGYSDATIKYNGLIDEIRIWNRTLSPEEISDIYISMDRTPPNITAIVPPPNGYGWYNNNVSVRFNCEDAQSGVVNSFFDVFFDIEGFNQSATGTCRDSVGNEANLTVSGINLDKTAPVIYINVPANGTEYLLDQVVQANWSAEDELSGMLSASGTVSSGAAIDTSTVGWKNLSAIASDRAGNSANLTAAYLVAYNYSGSSFPVKKNENVTTFKLGSAVPIRFQLKDSGGNYIANAVVRLYLAKIISDNQTGDEIAAVSNSHSSDGNLFRYDGAGNQYMFNLNTNGMSSGLWMMRLALEGTSQYIIALFE